MTNFSSPPLFFRAHVCAGYGSRDGRLLLLPPNASEHGGSADQYQAGEEPNIAVELARVNRPRIRSGASLNDARITAFLEFAQTFGHLSQDGSEPFPAQAAKKCPPKLAPEEMRWCLMQASALDMALNLGGACYTGETAVVDRQLAEVAKAARNQGGSLYVPRGMAVVPAGYPAARPRDKQLRAYQIIKLLLDANLRSERRVVGKQTQLIFARLIDLIYWQLADWLDWGRFGRCLTCLSFFPLTDNRQRYCPPVRGGVESRCAMRDRSRRRRPTVASQSCIDWAANEPLLWQHSVTASGDSSWP